MNSPSLHVNPSREERPLNWANVIDDDSIATHLPGLFFQWFRGGAEIDLQIITWAIIRYSPHHRERLFDFAFGGEDRDPRAFA